MGNTEFKPNEKFTEANPDFVWTEELIEYDRRLWGADWHYHFSDDYGQWSSGLKAMQTLQRQAETSPQHLTLYIWHGQRVNGGFK